jgi:UPF0716 protein FxsA
MGRLLLLFTAVPLIELYLLLVVGRFIGLGPTVALVLVTGMLGAWLAKAEGMRVIRRWQQSLARGAVPEEGVLDGVLVLVGGVLLVTPGVLTDVLGLALLFPPSRKALGAAVRKTLERRIERGDVHVVSFSSRDMDFGGFGGLGGGRGPVSRGGRGGYIDVDGEEVSGGAPGGVESEEPSQPGRPPGRFSEGRPE